MIIIKYWTGILLLIGILNGLIILKRRLNMMVTECEWVSRWTDGSSR